MHAGRVVAAHVGRGEGAGDGVVVVRAVGRVGVLRAHVAGGDGHRAAVVSGHGVAQRRHGRRVLAVDDHAHRAGGDQRVGHVLDGDDLATRIRYQVAPIGRHPSPSDRVVVMTAIGRVGVLRAHVRT